MFDIHVPVSRVGPVLRLMTCREGDRHCSVVLEATNKGQAKVEA